MIIEWIISAFASVAATVFSWIPPLTLPSWWTQLLTTWDSLIDTVHGLGVWIPLVPIGLSAALILSAMGISFAIRLIRMALSLFTGGGGSAA